MEAYLISPHFFGYNVAFLIIFAIITLLVSIFAYRIYKLTKQNQLKLFSIAFLAFSIGYILRALVYFLISFRLIDVFRRGRVGRGMMPLQGLFTLEGLLGNFHVLFIIAGLVVLVYMTLKVKNIKIMLLLFGVIAISMIFTPRDLFIFHITSSLLLAFVVLYYYDNYKKHKKFQTMLVLVAFVFLFFGQLALIFSVQSATFFMLGRILELTAYLCILTNLILITKK